MQNGGSALQGASIYGLSPPQYRRNLILHTRQSVLMKQKKKTLLHKRSLLYAVGNLKIF